MAEWRSELYNTVMRHVRDLPHNEKQAIIAGVQRAEAARDEAREERDEADMLRQAAEVGAEHLRAERDAAINALREIETTCAFTGGACRTREKAWHIAYTALSARNEGGEDG